MLDIARLDPKEREILFRNTAWRVLGYGINEPWEQRSKTQRAKEAISQYT